MARPWLAASLALVLLAAPRRAEAGLPRLLVGDLHGQADLREVGVGVQVLVAAALARSGAVEVVARPELQAAFATLKAPPREGLWIGPAEARPLCELTRCTQLLTGTLRRDAARLQITLRLLQHDGSVAKTARLVHPLRQLPLLAQAVAAKARELTGAAAPPPPAVRAATLRALGAAWVALQKKDLDLALVELELASRPQTVALQFAAPAGDLAAVVAATQTSPGGRVRAQLVVQPAAALKDAEALSEANRADVGARFLYARALIASGHAHDALEVLAPRAGEPDIAEAHLLRARAHLGLGRPGAQRAIQELRRALELDPQNLDAHLELGFALARTRDPEAVRQLEAAAQGLRDRGDGRYSDAFLQAIQLDARMGRVWGALEARDMTPEDAAVVERAVAGAQARAPGQPGLALARGAAAALGGNLAASKSALLEAREQNPGDAAIALLLARVLAEQGDHKAAAQSLAAAYALQPSPLLALDAAREARAAGDRVRARQFYLKALAAPTCEAAATRELGELDLAEGDARTAAERLRKAADSEPDDAEVHLALARARELSGDPQAANAARAIAAGLDPEALTERGTASASAPSAASEAKPAAGAAAQVPSSDASAELAAQLPSLLGTFPPLRGRRDDASTDGGTVALVHAQPSLPVRLLPMRPVRYAILDRAFAQVLATDYRFARVAGLDQPPAADPEPAALAALGARIEASLVVHYAAAPAGGNLKLTVSMYDRGALKLYENSAVLHAPSALGPPNFVPLALAITVLGGLLVFAALRPRGTLLVKIEYDPTMDAGFFSLRVTRLRRSGMGLKGGTEQQFVDAVRKKGSRISKRSATMVGKETVFPLPAGRYWVYLFGVYMKDGRPAGNFLTEKQVVVPNGSQEIAEFNLIPEETSVLVKVELGGQPVYGAAVWLDGKEHTATFTNKMADGVLMVVPRGLHTLTARHQGLKTEQQLAVTSPFPMQVVVELGARAKAAIDLPAAAQTVPSPPSTQGYPAPYQGRVYDLENAPEATAQPTAERYQIKEELGRGAMGVVYQAVDTVLEREVALKVISQDLQNRPDVVELFMREARSLAALNHPNIVTVYDFGQRGSEYFMALELIHGATLEHILQARGSALPLPQALDIAIAVCTGLQYAHERRVIHRDIKPGNIFVLPDGRVKIMDFGLARVVRELSIKKTMVSGTPLYMSPEQIRGTDLDFRSDLYSLGCMLYEMVTGSPPFSAGEVLYHHTHTEPVPPSRQAPGLPPELDSVLLCCLAKDKEQRYPSVAELERALRGVRGQLSASIARRAPS